MFKGQDWGLASRTCHGGVSLLCQITGWQWETLPRLEQADVAFQCVNFHRQLISPTNFRPMVLAKPLPRTLEIELPTPALGRTFLKTKLVKLICDYDFFFLLETCWEPDSMMLSLFLLFQTNTPVVLFCFLVKKILDTDLTMDSFPPVFLISNSPSVFLTC